MSNPTTPSEKDPKEMVELPAPTVWPMVSAFGIGLLALGLVTDGVVSLVGVVVGLTGAVGWWKDVLPRDREERVPWVPLAERAKVIVPVPARVEHLRPGQEGHRVRIPVEMHPYSAGITAGLAGGVVMAVLALGYGLVAQGSLWFPVNLLSASAMPSMAQASLQQLKEFNTTGLLVGVIIHGMVSMLVGFVYAVILPMFPRRAWVWAGFVLPLFWSGLFYGSSRFIDPALSGRVDWPWFLVCQIAFGLVTGAVVARTERIETRQTWPLAARMDLEGGRES